MQNTYVEYNWAGNNLGDLIKNRLNLNSINQETTNDFQYIIDTYKTPSGRPSDIETLTLKFKIFIYYGHYIIESILVTGDFSAVFKLFKNLYGIKATSQKKLRDGFSKAYMQDLAIFIVHNGEASITIRNILFKNIEDFKNEFEKRKKNYIKKKGTEQKQQAKNINTKLNRKTENREETEKSIFSEKPTEKLQMYLIYKKGKDIFYDKRNQSFPIKKIKDSILLKIRNENFRDNNYWVQTKETLLNDSLVKLNIKLIPYNSK